MHKTSFASFWHGGAMSPYELACLFSFAARGHKVAVYSYEPIAQLPAGLTNKDAKEIMPPDSLLKFVVDGVPSIAHFTDYFRYVMFTKTDCVWIDTDLFLLRDFDLDATGDVIGRETANSICGAIMRLRPTDPRLNKTIQRLETFIGKPIRWGETGPRLLNSVYDKAFIQAASPPNVFYPVHYDDYYKVFLPEFAAECEALCKDAYTLHLWNNLVVKTGVWKNIGPPRGSFLYSLFERIGATAYFADFYPTPVMKVLVHNAVVKAGSDSGVTKVLGLLGPCVKHSIYRRSQFIWG